jgi:protein-L-isoaspartate(D-aspartate) O-methyltransferase
MSDFTANRRAMIDSQLRTNGIMSPAVIAAMGTLPREKFVPDSLQSIAYMDRSIPLGQGRHLNPPLSAGLILEHAAIKKGERILLIGAGTGYLATLIAGQGAQIVATEESADLLAQAQYNLAGQSDVTLIAAPLASGAAEYGPYSLVIIDGAIETLPQAIVDQLEEGGRIISGVAEGAVRRLASGIKRGGSVALRPFADTEIAVLPGFAHAKEFVF